MTGFNVPESLELGSSGAFEVLDRVAYLDVHGLSGASLIRVESGEMPEILRGDDAIIDAVKSLGKPINDKRSVTLESYQKESNTQMFSRIERNIMESVDDQVQTVKPVGPKLN